MGLAELRAAIGEEEGPGGLARLKADVEKPPDTRSAFGRWYESKVKPVTDAVTTAAEPVVRAVTEPLVDAARVVSEGESLNQVNRYPAWLLEKAGAATGGTRPIVEMAIPQTPTELGIMAAIPGARAAIPALKAAPRGWQAVRNILAGAGGGTVGDVAEGGSGARGAAVGAGSAAVGEVLGSSTASRIAPGGQRAIAQKDAERVGRTLEEIVPALRGARSARDLRELAGGRGQAALGEMKERATVDAESALASRTADAPGMPPRGEIPVPSVATRERIGTSRGVRPERPAEPPNVQEPPYPGMSVDTVYGATPRQVGTQPTTGPQPAGAGGVDLYGPGPKVAADTPITVGRDTFTLREANDRLSEIGARAFSRDPAERNFAGIDQRKLYGQVYREIVEGIRQAGGPEAAAAWEAAQGQYSKGLALIGGGGKKGVLDRAGAYDVSRGEISMRGLQTILADPKVQRNLRVKLGEDDYARLVDSITRGAGVGERDVLASGPQTMLGVLRDLFGEQRGGTAKWASAIPRLFAPNLPTKYVGRAPDIGARSSVQSIIDAVLGSRADRLTRGEE